MRGRKKRRGKEGRESVPFCFLSTRAVAVRAIELSVTLVRKRSKNSRRESVSLHREKREKTRLSSSSAHQAHPPAVSSTLL